MSKSLEWNFRPTRDWGSDWAGYFAEYRAQLEERKAEVRGEKAEKMAPPTEVPEARRIELDELVKRNKNGTYSAQSDLGKIVNLALERGWELIAGRAGDFTWVQGATHGHRLIFTARMCWLDGQPCSAKELIERLKEE